MDFGKGNLGKHGIDKFLSTHKCNGICKYLKLPQINPKDKTADGGTMPAKEFMAAQKIEATKFDAPYYYVDADLYKSRQSLPSLEGAGGFPRRRKKGGKDDEFCQICTIL